MRLRTVLTALLTALMLTMPVFADAIALPDPAPSARPLLWFVIALAVIVAVVLVAALLRRKNK